MPFKKGDVVECARSSVGLTTGKRYEVTDPPRFGVRVSNDSGLIVTYTDDCFKLAEVRAGDVVECANDWMHWLTKGNLYTVLEVDDIGPFYKVTSDDGEKRFYKESRFKLVLVATAAPAVSPAPVVPVAPVAVDPALASIGDTVECFDAKGAPDWLREGGTYRVAETNVSSIDALYRLLTGTKNTDWLASERFTVVQKAGYPKEPRVRAKAGDKVRCMYSAHSSAGLKVGAEYEVLDVLNTHGVTSYLLVGINGRVLNTDRFEVMPAAPKPTTLKAGDKVRCIRDSQCLCKLALLAEYEVTGVRTHDGREYVCVKGYGPVTFYADRFELIPADAPAPTNFAEIGRRAVAGDTVRCFHVGGGAQDYLAIGAEYKVTKAWSLFAGGNTYYELEGVTTTFLSTRFEVVEKVAPVPAPAVFEVGDYVKCVDVSSGTIGGGNNLEIGGVYRVESVQPSELSQSKQSVRVSKDGEPISGSKFSTRFVKVEPAITSLQVGDYVKYANPCLDVGGDNVYRIHSISFGVNLYGAGKDVSRCDLELATVGGLVLSGLVDAKKFVKAEKPAEPSSKLKVDDLVKCIVVDDSRLLVKGNFYTIISADGHGFVRVKTLSDTADVGFWFDQRRFVKVELPPMVAAKKDAAPAVKIKAGDTVELVTSSVVGLTTGMHYVVESVDGCWVRVKGSAELFEACFKLVSAAKFKVGDTVKYVERNSYQDRLTPGGLYTVESVTDLFVRVRDDKGSIDGWSHEQFEVVPAAKKDAAPVKIKTGDKVKCITKSRQDRLTFGKVYTVESTEWRWVRIRDDKGKIDGWPGDLFEVVPFEEVLKANPVKIKAGDVVECIDDYGAKRGSAQALTKGFRYVVKSAHGLLHVERDDAGGTGGWLQSRFKVVEGLKAGTLLVCVDSDDAEEDLTEGGLYTLLEDENIRYKTDFQVACDSDGRPIHFRKGRFRVATRADVLAQAQLHLDAFKVILEVAATIPA